MSNLYVLLPAFFFFQQLHVMLAIYYCGVILLLLLATYFVCPYPCVGSLLHLVSAASLFRRQLSVESIFLQSAAFFMSAVFFFCQQPSASAGSLLLLRQHPSPSVGSVLLLIVSFSFCRQHSSSIDSLQPYVAFLLYRQPFSSFRNLLLLLPAAFFLCLYAIFSLSWQPTSSVHITSPSIDSVLLLSAAFFFCRQHSPSVGSLLLLQASFFFFCRQRFSSVSNLFLVSPPFSAAGNLLLQ